MNEFPIQIDGKEYIFTVNRQIFKQLNIDLTVNSMAKSIETVEDMFYAFIKTNHPMSREDAMKLMDKAQEELGGFKIISEAMGVIAERGFTTNTNAKGKIDWLETKTEETVNLV